SALTKNPEPCPCTSSWGPLRFGAGIPLPRKSRKTFSNGVPSNDWPSSSLDISCGAMSALTLTETTAGLTLATRSAKPEDCPIVCAAPTEAVALLSSGESALIECTVAANSAAAATLASKLALSFDLEVALYKPNVGVPAGRWSGL